MRLAQPRCGSGETGVRYVYLVWNLHLWVRIIEKIPPHRGGNPN